MKARLLGEINARIKHIDWSFKKEEYDYDEDMADAIKRLHWAD